jgi:hypothetical protein
VGPRTSVALCDFTTTLVLVAVWLAQVDVEFDFDVRDLAQDGGRAAKFATEPDVILGPALVTASVDAHDFSRRLEQWQDICARQD